MFWRQSRLYFIVALVTLLGQLLLPLLPVQAQTDQSNFDPNFIITDDDFLNFEALDLNQITAFLKEKGGKLANYIDPVTHLPAAQIIYQTAQDFNLSPKFLITLLQKEQSLVERTASADYNFDWAAGYGVCDSCDPSDPLLQKFKGFYNQVYNAAKRIRNDYLTQLETTGQTITGLGPGITKTIDNTPVTPRNRVTAILYTYTPHLKGNQLFWVVWNKYFGQNYPDGSLLNVEGSKDFWLIQNGTRRHFSSQRVFLSRYASFDKVLTVTSSEINKYSEGNPIQFPNYAYLRTPDGATYLLIDDVLRKFNSPESLRKIGINPEEIIKVKAEDISSYALGEPITPKSIYPLGAILQDKASKQIYWVQDGLRHPLASLEVVQSNWPGRKPVVVPSKQIATYPLATPIFFRDGELVRGKSDSAVYLIVNKQRRPFTSLSAFKSLGYEEKNIITTADEAILLHELGPSLTDTY